MTGASPMLASLSLDLDNQWSYMKTRGDPDWESLPSYLDVVVPRVLEFLAARGLKITFFIVGQDAAMARNGAALKAITDAGHEVGNHSFRHEPWLHLYGPDEVEQEIARAEDAIAAATGQRPTGFRGPGFSLSPATLAALLRRGYRYDASTFPTFLGPLARAYYFLTARLSAEQKAERKALFGSFAEGLRPVRPYRWNLRDGTLIELPVTTMPIVKAPFHVSYLIYLAGYSPALADLYFRFALTLCQWTGVEPSLLLHPLDFLGADDGLASLAFFPGMNLPATKKLQWLDGFLAEYARRFTIVPMGRHVAAIEAKGGLRLVEPRLPGGNEVRRSDGTARRSIPSGPE
jgi:hypothetical protein